MLASILNRLFTPLAIEKTKLRLNKVFFLTTMWVIAGLFFAANQLLKSQPGETNVFPDIGISSGAILITILFATAIVGIINGSFEAVMSEKRQNKRHVGKLILYSSLFYLLLYFFLFIAGIFIYKEFFMPEEITIAEYKNQIFVYITSSHALLSFIIFGTFVSFSLFLQYTREKFGSNIMSSFLSGKYFFPKEEKRIFMFLDIKSATTIAENSVHLNIMNF